MSAATYDDVAEHAGHKLACVGYGGEPPVNVAVECEDCCEVLVDAEHPDRLGLDDYDVDGADRTLAAWNAIHAHRGHEITVEGLYGDGRPLAGDICCHECAKPIASFPSAWTLEQFDDLVAGPQWPA